MCVGLYHEMNSLRVYKRFLQSFNSSWHNMGKLFKQPLTMSLALHLLVIILLQCNQAFAMQTVVLVGDSTILYCNGSVVNWLYYRLSDDTTNIDIFMDDTITKEFSTLGFRIEGNEYSSNLIIENVTIDLAGRYVCNGFDILNGVWTINETQQLLIVLENPPECDVNANEFVGPNDCNVPLDDILLSCSVGYRGNKDPELEWRQHGEPIEVIGSKCTQESNTLRRCNTTVKQDVEVALNGSYFICQTTRRALEQQYSCSANVAVLYSFSSEESTRTTIYRGDKVICVANSSSQSCSYKWVWYERIGNDISRTIESTDNVLIARRTGLHRCEAQCDLRNHACLVYPKFVYVIQSEESLRHDSGLQQPLKQENCQWTPAANGLIIMGVLPYVAFACYLLFTRIRRKKTSDGNLDKTNETVSETQE